MQKDQQRANSPRYGDTMLPLRISALGIDAEMLADPLVLQFIELSDATGRAEKISDPDDWTNEERQAYRRGDTVTFSRLRGYTEAEIAQFLEMIESAQKVDEKYGQDWAATLAYLIDYQTMPDRF